LTSRPADASPRHRGPGADEALIVDDWSVYSRAEVEHSLETAGLALLALCPDPSARVGVIGENRAETLLAHAAGIRAGVGTVALAKTLSAPEIVDQCHDAGVVAVVTGPSGLDAVLKAAKDAGLRRVVLCGSAAPDGRGDLVESWQDWLDGAPTAESLPPATRPANPPLVYTSGTTGRARGTHVRWATLGGTSADYLQRLTSGFHGPFGPHLVVGPLQHNGPLTAVRNLLAGCPVIVLGKFDPERVLHLIEQWKVTTTVMVPTHFGRLLALPEETRRGYDVTSLVQVAHTGSACPADVKRAMIDWWGPVLLESYGGTECGTVTRITSQEWLQHPRSVGRVVPPFQVVVVDENGADVAPGEVGILGFAGPPDRQVSYHGDPEKTAQAYVRPGVFTLGDVGRVDEEGFVFITDRISDMVVSGGVNLYPAESENVLVEHPEVVEVAVIGVPHPDLGEQLLALVVPRDPAHPPAASELEAYCRARIAPYKCPRRYEFVDTLARNAMNKLDKRALRRPYWADGRTIAG